MKCPCFLLHFQWSFHQFHQFHPLFHGLFFNVFIVFHPFISLWDDEAQWHPHHRKRKQSSTWMWPFVNSAVARLDPGLLYVVICCYCIWYVVIICYPRKPQKSHYFSIYIYFRRGSWPQFIKISCWHQQSSLFMWVLWLYDRLCMLYGYVSSIYHDITIFVAFKSHQDCGPEHQLLQKLRKVRVFVVIKKSYCLMFLKWNPMVDISECMG